MRSGVPVATFVQRQVRASLARYVDGKICVQSSAHAPTDGWTLSVLGCSEPTLDQRRRCYQLEGGALREPGDSVSRFNP
jgi:hypothetical protein